jgi:Ser-tRNA(Ala) deacylase AlaX
LKIKKPMQDQLNEAKKLYACDMHTAEHILNQTMVRMFNCGRSMNAHIERKKSKCDYMLAEAPTPEQVEAIVRKVNEVIDMQLPVVEELMSRSEAATLVDLSKLPDDASQTLRVIKVGDYDACACIGQHVTNTSEIGKFEIISHDFENGRWRVRFKLIY